MKSNSLLSVSIRVHPWLDHVGCGFAALRCIAGFPFSIAGQRQPGLEHWDSRRSPMGEIPNSARVCFLEASEANTYMGIRVSNKFLRVGGFAELTAANSDKVGRKIRADLNGHTSIEIDLSRTTFMDCTGLGALIALRNLARARNGAVRLVNPTPTVQRLFDIMRAGHMFEIINTRPTDHA